MALTSHDSQRNPSWKSFTQVWGSFGVNHTRERAKTFEKFCALRTNLTQQNLWKFWLARACRSDKTIWEFWEWTLCNGKEGNGEKEKEKAKRRKAKTRIVFTFLRVLTLLFFQFGLLFALPTHLPTTRVLWFSVVSWRFGVRIIGSSGFGRLCFERLSLHCIHFYTDTESTLIWDYGIESFHRSHFVCVRTLFHCIVLVLA